MKLTKAFFEYMRRFYLLYQDRAPISQSLTGKSVAAADHRPFKGIRKLAQEGQIVADVRDLLKEPLVLEWADKEEARDA